MPSGDIWANVTLQPVVDTLTRVIKPMDIVNLFATGVAASIVIVLVWFGCKWIYSKFVRAVRGRKRVVFPKYNSRGLLSLCYFLYEVFLCVVQKI